jgi:tight adherence protein B
VRPLILRVGPLLLKLAAIKWAAFGCLVFGVFGIVFFSIRGVDSLPYRLWSQYTNHLEAELRLMFLPTKGKTIALGQAAALAGLLALMTLGEVPLWWLLLIGICIGPPFYIKNMKAKRLEAIEGQLNTFTVSLANALKTTPSLGDALRITGELISQPIQDEINYTVKAIRFGASVDQALALTAARIGSPDVDMVFSALLIGRNIGGDLPTILDTTAASLREMTRLHQVLKAKTAEGRAQIWVLAVFPLVIMFGLAQLMPGYYDPLTKSITGYVLAGLAGLCWGGSIVIARNIMNIDM